MGNNCVALASIKKKPYIVHREADNMLPAITQVTEMLVDPDSWFSPPQCFGCKKKADVFFLIFKGFMDKGIPLHCMKGLCFDCIKKGEI